MEYPEEFEKILKKFDHVPYIRPEMVPDIDLYVDQVTTFMEDHLKELRRSPEDKPLTKTMINNYTKSKNNLLPPPVRKKYTRNHMFLLIYIYYLKNILSIGDIETLLRPMTEHYWDPQGSDQTMESIYSGILSLEKEMFRNLQEDVREKMDRAMDFCTESAEDEEEQEYLQNLALVSMLGFDVYLKRQMMETIIDDMKKKDKD